VRGVNYAFDVSEIKVKKGETVTINFESTDGFHDFVVDAFGAKTKKVQPGVKTSVTFVADESGTFEYYCSVGSHKMQGMVGKLIVED
jgi:nitrite reductase (NO-forming)